VVVVFAAVAAAAEWLREPAWVWVAAVALALAATVLLLWPLSEWRRRGLAAALTGLLGAMAVAQSQLGSIEHHWPEERQRRVDAASRRWPGIFTPPTIARSGWPRRPRLPAPTGRAPSTCWIGWCRTPGPR
jgi:hypothetical protein